MENKTVVPKVYAAVNSVMADISLVGISKDRKNEQQGYKFRGIDEVYGALAPLLSKYKLMIVPTVLKRDQTERQSRGGGALFSVVLDVAYKFISAEDGSEISAQVVGEAMDSADKATNKAMSAAFKYVCLQVFCIPVIGENPDADQHTPEPASSRAAKPAAQPEGNAEGETLKVVSRVAAVEPTKNPAFFKVVSTEGLKASTSDEAVLAIAREVMKTQEEVRFHYEQKGRFADLVALERRAPKPVEEEVPF